MSVHLVGGGGDGPDQRRILEAFLDEVAEHAAATGRVGNPRVGLVLVRPAGGDGDDLFLELAGERSAILPVDVVPIVRVEGDELDLAAINDLDGLEVSGGLTPAYLTAVTPVAGEVRRRVAEGMPYLGSSAGAMIAAERALVGGWRLGGVAVAPEATGEDLDELTIEQGLGLIDVTVDVHAAQWGTVGRAIAAVESGLVDAVVAIDEDTALVVGNGALTVRGGGSVWRVTGGDQGVSVSTLASDEGPDDLDDDPDADA